MYKYIVYVETSVVLYIDRTKRGERLLIIYLLVRFRSLTLLLLLSAITYIQILPFANRIAHL